MKKLNNKKVLLLYSTILIVTFYLLPLLFKGGIALLFVINPLIVLLCSIVCSKNKKLSILIALIIAILFFPSIYIFYNESAWIYTVIYTIISIVGIYIGLKQNK